MGKQVTEEDEQVISNALYELIYRLKSVIADLSNQSSSNEMNVSVEDQLKQPLTSEDLDEIMALDMGFNQTISAEIKRLINFEEGSLAVDTVLTRLELMRAALTSTASVIAESSIQSTTSSSTAIEPEEQGKESMIDQDALSDPKLPMSRHLPVKKSQLSQSVVIHQQHDAETPYMNAWQSSQEVRSLAQPNSVSSGIIRANPSMHGDEESSNNDEQYEQRSWSQGSSETNPWRRTISRMSMTLMADTQRSFLLAKCTVSTDGVLSGPFYDRHLRYQVTVDYGDGMGEHASVSRRFKDFVFLHHILQSRYPMRSVPSLPRKGLTMHLPFQRTVSEATPVTTASSLNGQDAVRFAAQSDTFFAQRQRGLQHFLTIILNHQVLKSDDILTSFLTAEHFSHVRRSTHRVGALINEDTTDSVDISIPPNQAAANGVGPVAWRGATNQTPNYILDWEMYDDSVKWARVILDAMQGVSRQCKEFAKLSLETSKCLNGLAGHVRRVKRNTDNNAEDSAIAVVLFDLGQGQDQCALDMEMVAQTAELFHRLSESVIAVIQRIRSRKCTSFPSMLKRLVQAQSVAERVRIRGTSSTSFEVDLQMANSRIAQIQSEIERSLQKNALADQHLQEEIAWAVLMTREMAPPLLRQLLESLTRKYMAGNALCQVACQQQHNHL